MLIQTGSQELNKDSHTPLSTVTSSSLLEDTYILPKQPKDFICHHVLGLLGVSSCPSSAGINESCARKDIRRKSVLPLGN